jgi:hypothetical protein
VSNCHVDPHEVITGLLRHESYGVMARRLMVTENTIAQIVRRLKRIFQANDRWALEAKLRELLE